MLGALVAFHLSAGEYANSAVNGCMQLVTSFLRQEIWSNEALCSTECVIPTI